MKKRKIFIFILFFVIAFIIIVLERVPAQTMSSLGTWCCWGLMAIVLGAILKLDENITQFLQIRWARALRYLARAQWYQELVNEIGETILRIKKGGA
ncbi:MAG: hypothetical protein WCW93_00260 [Candidatus Paceibacterota bacterium]